MNSIKPDFKLLRGPSHIEGDLEVIRLTDIRDSEDLKEEKIKDIFQ